MEKTRRDLLKFAGGSAMGLMFTPVPWRLITDIALRTQSWPGVPSPARGEIKVRFTNCPLCPAGCAVRARCVGDMPVSLAGVKAHPQSAGAMCPLGLTGHHLPFHPDRLKPGSSDVALAAVVNAIEKCGPNERVAVLDLRPGRTASWTYRRAMAAVKNGMYLTGPRPLGRAAIDLAKARTVLSIGAPLFGGWGTPGNVARTRDGFRLIQAEPLESPTATLADLWLRIRPGSGSALALGIANVLLDRKPGRQAPARLAEMAAGFTPSKAAAATGLSETQIVELAGELTGNGPALVLAGDELPEALALNQLTSAWGQTIVARREAPVPDSWNVAAPVLDLSSVADGSIRALLIDESAPGDYIPWSAIARKLVRDTPVVVTFAWSPRGYGRHALFVLPTAVYPEVADDIQPAVDSPGATFRISAPLIAPPAGMVNPADFIVKAAGKKAAGIRTLDALRERADAVHRTGRGSLFTYADEKFTPVREVTPEVFWKSLNEGGSWMDAEGPASEPPSLDWTALQPGPAGGADLPLVAVVSETFGAGAPGSPIMSKLDRESNLRLGPNRAALHPETARSCGVEDRALAVLETPLGKCNISVILNSSVPPGVVEVAADPEVIDLCGAFSRAKVVRA